MASADGSQNAVSALCTHLSRLSLHPICVKDIEILCTHILNSSPNIDNELTKFASNVSVASVSALDELNEELSTKSVILGNGLKVSPADIVVFAAVYSSVISESDRFKVPHLVRWLDYVQSIGNFGEQFGKKIIEKKVPFDPPAPKKGTEPEITKEKSVVNKAAAEKKLPGKVDEKDKDISVSLLKIQIGHVKKAWKHPSAESLLVEEIDIGEAKCRQVVSGLAKYCSPEQLTNRLVVLVTNLKPSKLRDVLSEGMVLCASNEDHTVVEPLIAPEGSKIGECVTFSGHDGEPENILNPKKKQFEKISVSLFTDDKGIATFKGIPFMTSAGPCTSSIPRASVK